METSRVVTSLCRLTQPSTYLVRRLGLAVVHHSLLLPPALHDRSDGQIDFRPQCSSI